MNVRSLSEGDVRAMRDRVFDHTCSDTTWNTVRKHWLAESETEFLRRHDFPLATRHSREYLAENPTRPKA